MGRPTDEWPAARLLHGLFGRDTPAVGRGARVVPTSRPPIEKVAADARRLHRQLESLPTGTSFVRASGIARAYDYVLAIACEQLEVPTRLLDMPEGRPRILERLRLEFMLGECGLRI